MVRRPAAMLRTAIAAVSVLALAIAASWPLGVEGDRLLPSGSSFPDTDVGIYAGWQFASQVTAGRNPFQAPLLLWPHGQDTALLLWNLGTQALMLPFYLLFEPIQAFGLGCVGFGMLNGLAGWLLGRTAGDGRWPAGLAGATVLACAPFAWGEMALGRTEQGLLAPLALAFALLVHLRRAPGRTAAVAMGIAWAATGLCYWFYAVFFGLVVAVVAVVAALRRGAGELRALGLSAGVALVVAVPFGAPLLAAAAAPGSALRRAGSAEFEAHLGPMVANASIGLASSLLWPLSPPVQLRDAVPLAVTVTVVAALVRRRAWLASLTALAGLLLALGPTLQLRPGAAPGIASHLPFAWLQACVPGFSRLWWPNRFLALTFTGAAAGAGLLASGPPAGRRRVVAGALVLLTLGELRAAQHLTTGGLIWDAPEPYAVPALFRELAANPGSAPLLVLPYRSPEAMGLKWVGYHQQPVTTGLAYNEDALAPAAWLEAMQGDPLLGSLDRLTRARNADPRIAALLRDDREHAWAVLLLDPTRRRKAVYLGLFGREPDFEDNTVAAWKLGGASRLGGGEP